jgi:hypothetical protein
MCPVDKRCSSCGKVQSTTAFSKDKTKKDGLRNYCRSCSSKRAKAYRARTDICKSCRTVRTDLDEEGRCSGCVALKALPSVSCLGVGRPGCILYKGCAIVVDEEKESWFLAEIKNCQVCGVDQHLDICLDCSEPVGSGDKQKKIRPLKPCPQCGEWSAGGMRCYSCRA